MNFSYVRASLYIYIYICIYKKGRKLVAPVHPRENLGPILEPWKLDGFYTKCSVIGAVAGDEHYSSGKDQVDLSRLSSSFKFH
jgi:hypothetical protein